MSDGAELIAVERRRQVEAEGWTAEHDAEHSHGELHRAAAAYLNEVERARVGFYPPRVPVSWRWDVEWWKPSDDPIRNLVKAGALIAAEIDRLTREASDD